MDDLTNLEQAVRNEGAARRLDAMPEILEAALPDILWLLGRTDIDPAVRSQLNEVFEQKVTAERARRTNEIKWRRAELEAGTSATRREYATSELNQALAALAELDRPPDEQEPELLRGCFNAQPKRF